MTLVFALVVMQGIHLYRGEDEEAVAMGDEIVALCREYELAQEREWGRSFQGSALADLGRTDEGIEQLADSLAVQLTIGSGLVRTAFLALLGDAMRKVGRVEEGLKAVDEGFAHAERNGRGRLSRRVAPGARRAPAADWERRGGRGEPSRGNHLRARTTGEIFRVARRDQFGETPVVVRTPGRSRAVLAPIYGWFTEGWSTADLIVARQTLSDTGGA